MKKCIIFGAGTYGQVYAAYLSEEFEIVGFVDDDDRLGGTTIHGVPVIGNFLDSVEFLGNNPRIVIFTPIGNNRVRSSIQAAYVERGFHPATFIHRDSVIHPSVELGSGVCVLPGTTIMPRTRLGNSCLVSAGVHIAHHDDIGDGVFFSQGANIGASIVIEDLAYFGIGSIVMTGVQRIGREAVVGAGSVVIRDVPAGATVAGNPARALGTSANQTHSGQGTASPDHEPGRPAKDLKP